MSFPRYPSYKPSGVEWLGEVPEYWEALPLRRLIHEVTSGTSVNAIDEPAGPGQAGVLKTSCVYTGEFRPEENKAILESELDRATCPVVAGSLVVSRMNTPELVGAAGLAKDNHPSLFLPDRLWQVSFKDCAPQFMNYWCKSVAYRSQVQLACSGTSSSMQNLSQDNFYSFIAPLPPAGEQDAIATFLDRETAKIDALIAEQQRLIELLQEKRQAVISHAVTKGLNPNAPMKDSGVEWLGEVPEHWEVKNLGLVTERITYGFTNPMPTEEEGPYMLTANDIENSRICFETCRRTSQSAFTEELTDKSRPVNGDILLTKDGSLGRVALYIEKDEPACINQSVALLRPNTTVCLGAFLATALSSDCYQEKMLFDAGGTTIKHIYISRLAKMPVAIPPTGEQEKILQHLESRTRPDELLIADSVASLTLLRERRSALISAAVTGQIDVRGLVHAEAGER